MRQRLLGFGTIYILLFAACNLTVPNPNKRHRDAAVDGAFDAPIDIPADGPSLPKCTANEVLRCDDTSLVRCNADGTGEVSEPCPFGCNPNEKRCASKPGPVCTANQGLRCDGTNLVSCNADGSGEASKACSAGCDAANKRCYACAANQVLRCDGSNLVRCNAAGTGEAIQRCSLGCDAAGKRCYDMAPSNGLGRFLGQAGAQPEVNLGDAATIDTDSGIVSVGATHVAVLSDIVLQSDAPTIRVFIVGSLTAKKVVVSGTNALALVSSGNISIGDVFSASSYVAVGVATVAGPGAYNSGNCKGTDSGVPIGAVVGRGGVGGGPGGGGFGSIGAYGGFAQSGNPVYASAGSAGGQPTGNASLVPLRGGCDGGAQYYLKSPGRGGGAVQLVSGTKISISGTVAANGSARDSGGSGGGILLEAPIVEVTGHVVANGGAGGTALFTGEDGGLADIPAQGHAEIPDFAGKGGNGAAGTTAATAGGLMVSLSSPPVWGGGGGGGVGRIRVNTAPDGQRSTGLFSPPADFGALGKF